MNEVNALLKRCFEAMGYLPGDYADAASAGVWLESHGLNGLSRITTRLAELESLASQRLELTAAESGHAILQANGISTLTCGQKIAELAVTMVSESQRTAIEVQQCSDPTAIVPAIAAIGRGQCSALAYCRTPDSMFCAYLLQPNDMPCIEQWSAPPAAPRELQTLHLVASQSASELQIELHDLRRDYGAVKEVVEAGAMQQLYDNQLEHGLVVSENNWKRLYATADAILVAATEQSRRGAGA